MSLLWWLRAAVFLIRSILRLIISLSTLLCYCVGREGSIFLLTGDIMVNRGPFRNSYDIGIRALFKMHRISALTQAKHGTLDKEVACGPCFQVTIRRHQYKLQLLYPKPIQPLTVFLGQPINESVLTIGKRNFGESVWIVWRKRYCCAKYQDPQTKLPIS